jgi:DNA-binding transcriptional MerR regulator
MASPEQPPRDPPGALQPKLLRALDRSPYEPYTGSDEVVERDVETGVQGYSGKRAADIVGISHRQLDYWARTGLIRPSVADAHGSGSRRRYSYRNLLELKLVKTLLDNGIKLESIREGFTYLRDQLGEDVSTAKLVIAGTSAVLVRENYELIDVVNRYQSEGMVNVLALDDVKEQVDAAIVELFPTSEASDDPISSRLRVSPYITGGGADEIDRAGTDERPDTDD